MTKELQEKIKKFIKLSSKADNLLTAKECAVLNYRYGLNDGYERTLADIGEVLNITRERVRQIQVDALKKITNFDKTLDTLS